MTAPSATQDLALLAGPARWRLRARGVVASVIADRLSWAITALLVNTLLYASIVSVAGLAIAALFA